MDLHNNAFSARPLSLARNLQLSPPHPPCSQKGDHLFSSRSSVTSQKTKSREEVVKVGGREGGEGQRKEWDLTIWSFHSLIVTSLCFMFPSVNRLDFQICTHYVFMTEKTQISFSSKANILHFVIYLNSKGVLIVFQPSVLSKKTHALLV